MNSDPLNAPYDDSIDRGPMDAALKDIGPLADGPHDHDHLDTITREIPTQSAWRDIAGVKPGIYPGMQWDEYHAVPALRQSVLSKARQSMAHLRHAMDHGFDETPAMRVGSAAHTVILEPGEFRKRYGVLDDDHDGRTKAGKAATADIEAQGLVPIKASEARTIEAMRRAVEAHPIAGNVVRAADAREVSLFWRDPVHRLPMKCRIDILWGTEGIAADYKTTRSADPFGFRRSVWSFGYDLQAAVIAEGCDQLGIDLEDYLVIAQEKHAPYDLVVYRISDTCISAATAQLHDIRRRYVECESSGIWPGRADGIVDIDVPDWAATDEGGEDDWQ